MLSNHKGHKIHISVFVPFVAIPGKRHATEFCKRLIDEMNIDSPWPVCSVAIRRKPR